MKIGEQTQILIVEPARCITGLTGIKRTRNAVETCTTDNQCCVARIIEVCNKIAHSLNEKRFRNTQFSTESFMHFGSSPNVSSGEAGTPSQLRQGIANNGFTVRSNHRKLLSFCSVAIFLLISNGKAASRVFCQHITGRFELGKLSRDGVDQELVALGRLRGPDTSRQNGKESELHGWIGSKQWELPADAASK